MPLRRTFLLLASLMTASACSDDAPEIAPDHVSADALRSHVTNLADDALGGRAPGTDGYDKAAIYVAEEFAARGLEPAGVSDSYFQPIVFKKMSVMPDTAQLILRGTGDEEPLLLQYIKSYYLLLNPRYPTLSLDAPMAFVGYGITAPEQGIDSYADIDMAGKIAVIMSGVPDGLEPEIGAVFSSLERKAADAAAAGAVGLVMVYSKEWEKVFPYPSRSARAAKGRPYWLMPNGETFSDYGDLSLLVRMAPDKSGLLFKGAKLSYAAVRGLAEQNQPLPSFDLKTAFTVTYAVEETVTVSSNVIGRLPADPPPDGQGPTGEAVMIISHLDHLGVGKPDDGDDVYNGAVDNALGVASIIEAAGALSSLDAARSRDVYFVALTAEEIGLQGSQYLARNLPMPLDALTGVLNIDMPVAFYPFDTIQPSGETHSNLGAFAARAAQRYGLDREDDPMPEEAIFVRSDHYSFVERGIPAIYLNIGVKASAGSGFDGLKQLDDFLITHYHRPSDEVDLPIDWQAAARFADIHVEMLQDLATTKEPIAWTEGSFFNQPRQQP